MFTTILLPASESGNTAALAFTYAFEALNIVFVAHIKVTIRAGIVFISFQLDRIGSGGCAERSIAVMAIG